MSTSTTQAFSCNCFTGYPIVGVDPNGQPTCGCSNDPLPPGQVDVLETKTGQRPPSTVNNYYVVGTQRTAEPDPDPNADDGLIFGFSPLLVIGAAAAGLWLLSSMSEGK